MTEVSEGEVRRAAMDLLARREHLRAELFQKLSRRFGGDAPLEPVLDELAADKLQSDARFVASYCRQRVERGYGPLRIAQELRQKRADSALVDTVLQDCGADWRELAERARRRKFGDGSPADLRDKARQVRFLQYRGFDAELVMALLR